MKIVLVVNIFPSASETFISNKVKWLSNKGYSITVLCARHDKQLFHALFSDDKRIQTIVLQQKYFFRFILLHPLLTLTLTGKKQARQQLYRKFRLYMIRKQKPDIVHFEFSGIGTAYLYEIKNLKCKTVVSCRGTGEKVKLLLSSERQEHFRHLMDAVDAVHCVSDDMRNTILPYCHNPSKIFINYPSIDPVFFSRQTALNDKKDTVTILSVGRLTFQKGYTTGIQAIRQFKQSGIPFQWLIAGDGPEFENIAYLVNYFELGRQVQLLGTKSAQEIKQLIEAADIYFLPSVYEGISNAVLEAMSMDLPVVATKSGGMQEVIKSGVNGLLADIYDHTALANHLILLKDAAMRKKIGDCARKTILQKFTMNRQAEKYDSVYTTLARTSKS